MTKTPPASGNLFAPLPAPGVDEDFADLFRASGVRVERIVSSGQATPAGQWLTQDWTEWVVLLQGSAGLRVDGETAARVLRPGDWMTLPAGLRHRVEWTDPRGPTVWLAVHAGETRPA